MISLTQLWLPIVLGAVFVFVASSLVHMVLKWHNSDYLPLPNEEAVREALNAQNPPPGQYVIPHCGDMKAMGTEAMQKKYKDGPVGFLVLKAPGPISMGAPLFQWFLFTLVVSFFVAYVGAHSLPVGTHYRQVFRITGCVAFLAYGGGAAPAAIWMGKPWGSAFKDIADALIYGLVTAGTFGWLWPHA